MSDVKISLQEIVDYHVLGKKKRVIYEIIEESSGRSYVGKTKNTLRSRLMGHILASKGSRATLIDRTIARLGVSSFSVRVLQECELDELIDREIEWISKQRSYEDGYNCSLGGEGPPNWKTVSPATRRAISEGNKGKTHSVEVKLKISRSVKKKFESEPELIAKISAAGRGRKQSCETIEKRREKLKGEKNPNFGKYGSQHPCSGPNSAEHNEKISRALVGRKRTPEMRKNISEAHKIPVVCVNDELEIVKRYASAGDVTIDGFSCQQVNRATRGHTKNQRHRGFFWFRESDFNAIVRNRVWTDISAPTAA